MRQDFHIHSTISFDGKSTIEEHIKRADALGLDEICITEHYNVLSPMRPTLKEGIDPRLPDLPAYQREIQRVRNLGYRSELRMGLELGLYNDLSCEITEDMLKGVDLDFILLGAHFNKGGRDYWIADQWGDDSKEKAQTQYLQNNLIPFLDTMDNYDVVAHITYFSRGCPYADKEIRFEHAPDEFDAALIRIIQSGKGIEINTSSYAPFGFTMPGISVVKRYRELGGSIVTIGSDAHHISSLYSGVDEAKGLLTAAGFTHYATYRDRKPVFHRL
ncbi:histidinol-phosphatase HisJ family protein [Eubacteriales bacterium OttesenSCG-928-M02]|nr:histidinol-phosphatase HisJ family protein [Eubacteriales bacterium OttesenSCG-928-M02]